MSANEFLPHKKSLTDLRAAVQHCQGCELFRRATQAVFGYGPLSATMMLVGEQPGDEEDLAGEPFVGPAGRWLNHALAEAGIARSKIDLTNAVKHFKWEERSVRQLHKKPSAREIRACEPWLTAEISVIQPRVIVCLGATAAQALLGRDFRITASQGQPTAVARDQVAIATWHPSATLRAPDAGRKEAMQRDLVADLQQAKALSESRANG